MVTEIQIGPLADGEMIVLTRPDGSPLEGYFGASVGDWGISASTGSPYFDSNGATPGEQAVIGIDPYGNPFVEPAVALDAEILYSSVEPLTVSRVLRQTVTDPVDSEKMLALDAARQVREDWTGPVDASIETRGPDAGRERRQVDGDVLVDVSAVAAREGSRDVRQKPQVLKDRTDLDAVLREMRERRETNNGGSR